MNETNIRKEAALRIAGFVVAVTGGFVFGRLVRGATDRLVEKHC